MRIVGRLGRPLAERALSYREPGATHPESERWPPAPGLLRYERTVRIGAGEACWQAASSELMSWGVKTRSGFTVQPSGTGDRRVRLGDRYWLVLRVGPVAVREPVQVTAVVDEPDRRGFGVRHVGRASRHR